MAEDRLLLQSEVAEILRCGDSTVKRLRITGKLAYIPGRPVKIRESELLAFIEATTVRAKPTVTTSAQKAPDRAAIEAQAREWALKTVLLGKPVRTPRTPKK